MMRTSIKLFFLSLFIVLTNSFVAQTNDPKPKEEEDAPKKKKETKLSEVIETDSLPNGELLKRAVNWVKVESSHFVKQGGTSSGNKAEFIASFKIKPKELNPEVDFTGKVTMKVTIDCKDAKYKYTISEIKHTSKSGKANGGSVDNVVPDCGSMVMKDLTWKKIKGEMLRDGGQVIIELKAGMEKSLVEAKEEEW